MNKLFYLVLGSLFLSACHQNSQDSSLRYSEYVETESNYLHGSNGIILGDKKTLSDNEVSHLTVKNCAGYSCGGSSYKFDSNGNEIYFSPSYNSSSYTSEFDSIGRRTISYDIYDEDSLEFFMTRYSYAGDSIFRHTTAYSDGKIEFQSKDSGLIKFSKIKVYKSGEKVIKQFEGDMHYPCGLEFKGPNEIYYSYLENGLISNIVIRDSIGDTVRAFDYDYTNWE